MVQCRSVFVGYPSPLMLQTACLRDKLPKTADQVVVKLERGIVSAVFAAELDAKPAVDHVELLHLPCGK